MRQFTAFLLAAALLLLAFGSWYSTAGTTKLTGPHGSGQESHVSVSILVLIGAILLLGYGWISWRAARKG